MKPDDVAMTCGCLLTLVLLGLAVLAFRLWVLVWLIHFVKAVWNG
jgi:hypothetical protein